jgi:hypothetical protein
MYRRSVHMMLAWIFTLLGVASVGFGVGPAAEGRVSLSETSVVVFSAIALVMFAVSAFFFYRCSRPYENGDDDPL